MYVSVTSSLESELNLAELGFDKVECMLPCLGIKSGVVRGAEHFKGLGLA